MKPRHIEKHELTVLSLKGCISVAIDLITYDKKYFPVLAYLLGRVLVADTIDNAIIMAKQSRFSFKIVTIQGEILSPGGSITGGSQKRSNSLLSRKRQLKEYEIRIEKLKTQLSEKKQLNNTLKKEIQDTQKMIEENTGSVYTTKSEIAVLKKQLQEKQNILEERNNRKKQLEAEKIHLESDIDEVSSQASSAEADIGNIDSQNIHSQRRAKDLQEQTDKNRETREKLAKDITDLKVRLATYKQEEIGFKQSVKTIEENLEIEAKDIKVLKEKTKENNDKIVSLEEKTFSYRENITMLTKSVQDCNELIESLKQQRESIKSDMYRAQEQLNKLEKEHNQIEKKLHDGSIQDATINIELNQIKNQLYERYSITVPEALKIKKELGSVDKMKNKLAILKKEIESLGPVNMQAIEDYDNLKNRYDFLKAQRDDLIKAKFNLDSLIEQMTQTMEGMLLTSIEQVNKEFNKVFSELFAGGKAELIIDGEGSILECGVDVNAQPPGKKLQNLSLLSGGERALTAIALLFGILNTKTTPFCVLDEIEAALDDANIERFTKYLKKVSKHTQFIIITHRKSTMEVADALYGISMEETAISKVLAVKMEK